MLKGIIITSCVRISKESLNSNNYSKLLKHSRLINKVKQN